MNIIKYICRDNVRVQEVKISRNSKTYAVLALPSSLQFFRSNPATIL
jgi:hypothetical protein